MSADQDKAVRVQVTKVTHKGKTANGNSISGLPESFKVLGQGYLGPIPIPVVIMALVVMAGGFILTKTYFGRYIFALGGNEEAARLAGVNISRMKIMVFEIGRASCRERVYSSV